MANTTKADGLSTMLLPLPALAQESNSTVSVLDAAKVPAVMARAVDGFIRPGYRHFTEEAATMEESMAMLCEAPSTESLLNAQSTFGDLVEAWSRIEIVRVGPVLDDNRFERILFYPDRKGTGLRQVQAALASGDATAADARQLASKSVAMQGLGALEFVLFGTGSETLTGTEGNYRCQYGTAIAANLQRLDQRVGLLLQNYPLFRHVALAPDLVIRYVYPLAGNESVIGVDYRNLPQQMAAIEKTLKLGKPVVAGPVNLLQGGSALVVRVPVLLAEQQQWGLIAAIMPLELLLQKECVLVTINVFWGELSLLVVGGA